MVSRCKMLRSMLMGINISVLLWTQALVGQELQTEQDPVELLLKDVGSAVLDGNDTLALSLLEQGAEAYPEDARIPAAAGRLYKSRELYRTALMELEKAAELAPGNTDIRMDIADTLGYMGRNDESAAVLEGLILSEQADEETGRVIIDDLAWMYFKTQRLEEADQLLRAALNTEFDINWAQTMGTVQAGLYNADEAEYWYSKAIEEALNTNRNVFASVAYYNLSLLKSAFYRFEESRAYAEKSTEADPYRSGGYLIQGNMDFLEWNLSEALSSYREAEALDDTPLARMDIAEAYRRTGRLDAALLSLKEIQENKDSSWMYHFGVDENQFSADLHERLAKTWNGKIQLEGLRPQAGLFNRLKSWFNRQIWRGYALYHSRQSRHHRAQTAALMQSRGNTLDAAVIGAKAAAGYPFLAMERLEEARRIETEIVAESASWYDLEMGLAAGNEKLLNRARLAFSSLERDPYERTLQGLASSSSALRHDAALELYRMNPGAMRPNGITLPIVIQTGGGSRTIERRIRSLLRRAGYTVHHRHDAVPGTAVLHAAIGEDRIKWFLSDPDGRTGASLESRKDVSRQDLASSLNRILDEFYKTPLEVSGL